MTLDAPETQLAATARSEPTARRWPRLLSMRAFLITLLILALLGLGLLATFPVSWAKSRIEREIGEKTGAPVSIGSVSREPFFSFTPTIIMHDLRVTQRRWAGSGDLVRADQLRLQLPLLPMLMGRGIRPSGIEARGLMVALVRDAEGRSSWRSGGPSRDEGIGLTDLVVPDGRFTLRDDKRHLTLAGTVISDRTKGLRLTGKGRFHEAAATVQLTGPPIAGVASDRPYPFTLDFTSPLLTLTAKGSSKGALNMRAMTLDMRARAPSLKYLDDIIQAGLFGSQPIDLRATVRHQGRDWFVDRIGGRVGRSEFSGKATVLKRDGRSKIDAALTFTQFDFDDLADSQGKAQGEALEARIGNRVLPNTRINLAKVGPTDGRIRFVAQKLLFRNESVFRSLKGVITLDHKLLTVDDVEAILTAGRMTGRAVIDHRNGISPRLGIDLAFANGRLGPLVGAPEMIDAPFRARIVLAGRGDTVRDALSRADGHAGIVAADGQIVKLAAAVLAQDMGKTIGAALGDRTAMVPLHCLAVGFDAKAGLLTAAPFLIDTAISRSRGTGTIALKGERIALTIGGVARDPSGLPLVDPIVIGGTLSQPAPRLSDIGSRRGAGPLLGAVVKSIGGALGFSDKKGPAVTATGPIDCASLSRHVLRGPA